MCKSGLHFVAVRSLMCTGLKSLKKGKLAKKELGSKTNFPLSTSFARGFFCLFRHSNRVLLELSGVSRLTLSLFSTSVVLCSHLSTYLLEIFKIVTEFLL